MKKISIFALLLTSFTAFCQQKTTGNVTLSSNMTVNLTLNNTTKKATLTLTGPSDRWFALQFGTFAEGDGMDTGKDFVYATDTKIVDGNMIGVAVTPNENETQNWTIVSNTVKSLIRTITVERDFSTNDTKDYIFNYENTSIDFAWARSSNASYSLANHSRGNRGYNVSVPIDLVTSIDDVSLKSTFLYPNPTNGIFSVESAVGLTKINVYSHTGTLVKTIEVTDNFNKVNVNLSDIKKGVYLIELLNHNDKAWKKLIIE